MQRQRRSDTEPEIALRRELHRRGLRFRLQLAVVPGVPRRRVDVVFAKPMVAVFVDGCFWHGCPSHGQVESKSNTAFWTAKIARNAARDYDSDARLRAAGWTVVRVWEHEDPSEAAERIERAVRGHDTES